MEWRVVSLTWWSSFLVNNLAAAATPWWLAYFPISARSLGVYLQIMNSFIHLILVYKCVNVQALDLYISTVVLQFSRTKSYRYQLTNFAPSILATFLLLLSDLLLHFLISHGYSIRGYRVAQGPPWIWQTVSRFEVLTYRHRWTAETLALDQMQNG